jgi:hypothetical protein
MKSIRAMLKTLFTKIFVVISLSSFAQVPDTITISGKMIAAVNDQPIPYGIIRTGNGTVVMTDSTGHFTITSISTKLHSLSFNTFAYAKNDTVLSPAGSLVKNFTWRVYPDCWFYSIKAAKNDIRFNERKINVQKGVVPVLNSAIQAFEKKYKVKFLFNNVTDVRQECMMAYNKIIFENLDIAYGTGWRAEVNNAIFKSQATVPNGRELPAENPKQMRVEQPLQKTIQSDEGGRKLISPPDEFAMDMAPEEDTTIYQQVESEAEFRGGESVWLRYYNKDLEGFDPADSGAVPGKYTIVVRFIVRKDGRVSDVKAETNYGSGMEQKVVQMIKNGPKWKPGMRYGRNVNSFLRKEIIIVAGKP